MTNQERRDAVLAFRNRTGLNPTTHGNDLEIDVAGSLFDFNHSVDLIKFLNENSFSGNSIDNAQIEPRSGIGFSKVVIILADFFEEED